MSDAKLLTFGGGLRLWENARTAACCTKREVGSRVHQSWFVAGSDGKMLLIHRRYAGQW